MDWALCALRPPYGPRNDREIVWILGSARSGRVEDQILPHIRANVRMVSSKKPLNPDSKAHEGYLGPQDARNPEPLAPLGFRASIPGGFSGPPYLLPQHQLHSRVTLSHSCCLGSEQASQQPG